MIDETLTRLRAMPLADAEILLVYGKPTREHMQQIKAVLNDRGFNDLLLIRCDEGMDLSTVNAGWMNAHGWARKETLGTLFADSEVVVTRAIQAFPAWAEGHAGDSAWRMTATQVLNGYRAYNGREEPVCLEESEGAHHDAAIRAAGYAPVAHIKLLAALMTGAVKHVNKGRCPHPAMTHLRDPDCPACGIQGKIGYLLTALSEEE